MIIIMEEKKKKYKTIKPSLFKIEISNHTYYIVAYDAKHALESLPNYKRMNLEGLKNITNLLSELDYCGHLYIAPECLGVPGLVDKIKEE
jgi:precorrin-6B methylase 2